jgi:hypothetical protein
MPNPIQVTKITRNGRISLGKAMAALNVEEGDIVQIFSDSAGTIRLAKVQAPGVA